MKSVKLAEVELTVWLETPHGDQLEFVLDEVGHRTGRDYLGELATMVNGYIMAYGGKVKEHGVYGHAWLKLGFDDPTLILPVMLTADQVVTTWRRRFNVDQMKPA